MASPAQIAANQANARKSTGPRSADGKAASRMNALKSGIDAKAQIVTGERASNLELLKSEYYLHFHPTSPIQRMLVDTLIDSEWLLRRFRVVEAQLWESGVRLIGRGDGEVSLGLAFDFRNVVFGRLQRRVNTALKNYYNALKELRQLQLEMPPAAPEPPSPPDPDPDPEPAPQPTPTKDQPPQSQNGFVPQSPVPNSPHQEFPIDTLPPSPTPEHLCPTLELPRPVKPFELSE